MKLNQYISCLLLAAMSLVSCQNFDDINSDPDASNRVTPSLLASGLLLNIMSQGGNKNFVYDEMLVKQLAWGEGMEDYQYNVFGRSSFGYTTLTNTLKMVEAAQTTNNNVNAYMALARFVKAWKIFYMSMEMGDIPYEEALQGETGLIQPRYNTQKEVMAFVLQDLEEAYKLFSAADNFTGDPFMDGDKERWKKVTRVFQLKLLMFLSKKENDTDLKIKEQFARIVAEGNLMQSNADNLEIKYADKANTGYPFHNTNSKHYVYAMLSSTIIDRMKDTEDIRMFYYAKPSKAKLAEGLDESDWNAYLGVDPSDSYEKTISAYSKELYCGLNARYTEKISGEPVVRVGYAEQNFILAEAVTRGWISGNAATYYKNAIKAHLNFIASNTPEETVYHHGHPLTTQAIAAFIESPAIQLTDNKEVDLDKILTQKYLASFMQNNYDVYYDYRRTGLPVFPVNPDTNRNTVKDKLPMRWMYPKSESDYNMTHLDEALNRQWNGEDDVNAIMWILQ